MILLDAFHAWSSCATLRKIRERSKRFTYGDQWGDLVRYNGAWITEGDRFRLSGRECITNNMIHQLVRTLVGRYRMEHLGKIEPKLPDEFNDIAELDARMLEEFLISGCAIQRVDNSVVLGLVKPNVENVNVNRFFVNSFLDPLGRDIEIIGYLHDVNIAELLRLVGAGSRRRAAEVRKLYSERVDFRINDFCASVGLDTESGRDFFRTGTSKLRVIEVWTRENSEILLCHDLENGTLTYESVRDEAKLRKNKSLKLTWDVQKHWHCRWYSPMGDLLCEYVSPYAHASHPFAVKMYPLTDGEVHGLVEDVIDQQKYLNRLVTLVDHILSSAAKGVLLYPETALPDGLTWEDVRKMWSSTNGILPYDPTRHSAKPEQFYSRTSDVGTYDMIKLQMQLFEEISGVSGTLQGKSSVGSKYDFETLTQNATLSLSDIYETFSSFLSQRNSKLLNL